MHGLREGRHDTVWASREKPQGCSGVMGIYLDPYSSCPVIDRCPSAPNCGRAVQVDGEIHCEPTCPCGLQFCFACLGEPHSPCSCEMYAACPLLSLPRCPFLDGRCSMSPGAIHVCAMGAQACRIICRG